jgi:AcrR family transcriptional regulator
LGIGALAWSAGIALGGTLGYGHPMATRAADYLSPRARQISAAAQELIDAEGIEALSMRALADRVGIRAPSIYKHFASKEALEAAVISTVFDEQASHFEAVVEDSDQPLLALAGAWRDYARRHPHLYRLVTEQSLNRAALVEGVEERAVRQIVHAAGGDRDLARAFWAFAHGMTILELNARFPPDADLDAAWRSGVEALMAATRETP